MLRRIAQLVAVFVNTSPQITCLYDMDIPRPENFNETYLYEGWEFCLR